MIARFSQIDAGRTYSMQDWRRRTNTTGVRRHASRLRQNNLGDLLFISDPLFLNKAEDRLCHEPARSPLINCGGDHRTDVGISLRRSQNDFKTQTFHQNSAWCSMTLKCTSRTKNTYHQCDQADQQRLTAKNSTKQTDTHKSSACTSRIVIVPFVNNERPKTRQSNYSSIDKTSHYQQSSKAKQNHI